jgi:hypothetical protein
VAVPDAARMSVFIWKLSDTTSGLMQESCCQGQHIYLHAQLMLTRLGRLPGGTRFRRLRQELELDAAKHHGHISWQMHFWCALGPVSQPASFQACACQCSWPHV